MLFSRDGSRRSQLGGGGGGVGGGGVEPIQNETSIKMNNKLDNFQIYTKNG